MFLKVENLQKFYSKKLPLIEKLSFSVNKGEIISFIGESGSGKTTFLKCLAGLEGINSGVISLNGEVLNNDNTFVKPHLRKIGFVFQDYPLFPHIDVIQNITLNLEEKFHNKQRGNSFDDISSLEDRIAEPKKNLRTHLMEQILLDIPEGLERKVAILLLDLIEPSGWIKLDIDEFVIKNNLQKECTLKVLEKLQSL